MIGIDIIEIERIKHAIERTSFFEKVFTDGEREYYNASGRVESLAGIYAAKESIAKALGTGIRGFGLNEIEVRHDALGRPFAEFLGKAKKLVGNRKIDISISHCGAFAIAIACVVSGSASATAIGTGAGSGLSQEFLDAKLSDMLATELDAKLVSTLQGANWKVAGDNQGADYRKVDSRRVNLFKTSESTVLEKKQNHVSVLQKNSLIDRIYDKAIGRK